MLNVCGIIQAARSFLNDAQTGCVHPIWFHICVKLVESEEKIIAMKISDMNWMQVEDYLQHDDRAVVPLGSTEQHAYLSLSVDSILSERVAVEAAEPLGVPVFPVQAYGLTPYFRAYPGTVSLRVETYVRLVRDILDSLAHSGFRRILLRQRARRQRAGRRCRHGVDGRPPAASR